MRGDPHRGKGFSGFVPILEVAIGCECPAPPALDPAIQGQRSHPLPNLVRRSAIGYSPKPTHPSCGQDMELREFAEQVLLGRTLEEKLRSPEILTDDWPGPPLEAPALPGRPSGLEFRGPGSARAEFPPAHRLGDDRSRGQLLHFFTNHELLATELMALVLLRFPEAPSAFRRGVLQTLRDEQAHTRMYLERMRQCGIEFGELPVSGYFWRMVSPMASPLDFVTGLSLTFEQANLDFCRHFARGFLEAGDDTTAGLLDRIYRDEIAHVAHGLKWFRRWKNPETSDWDAYCHQLQFPLSPTRARGITFNVEGRRAAGLDPGFIARLNVHSISKGRTPGVFVFNPFTEERLSRGPGYRPGHRVAALARDLTNLPQFLARQDDVVLVERRPTVEFLSGLKDAGFSLPEFVELEGGHIAPGDPLLQRKLARLRPWAWGPDSAALLEPLRPQLTTPHASATSGFPQPLADLYSKSWSASFLRAALTSEDVTPAVLSPDESLAHWLCTEDVIGVTVHSVDEAMERISAIRRAGHHRVVIKESLGLAGRNMMRLWEPAILDAQRQWLARALSSGRGVVVEPWLDRVADFSVQMEMDTHGLRIVGYTGLQNDARGQFQANWAGPRSPRKPPQTVYDHLPEAGSAHGRILRLYGVLAALLEPHLVAMGHTGPLGLDALVYRHPGGGCRLKPVVEINPRYTMGRLTLELMRQVAPGVSGVFRLIPRSAAAAVGCADLAGYARLLADRFPLELSGQPVPRIRSGALCLNDPVQAETCLAVLHVGPRDPGESPLPGQD